MVVENKASKSSAISTPYLIHKRDIDQYGYVSFDGNFYWVQGTKRPAYLEGRLSDEADLSVYEKLLEDVMEPQVEEDEP